MSKLNPFLFTMPTHDPCYQVRVVETPDGLVGTVLLSAPISDMIGARSPWLTAARKAAHERGLLVKGTMGKLRHFSDLTDSERAGVAQDIANSETGFDLPHFDVEPWNIAQRRQAGRSRSARKAVAVRENGAAGGRPRKELVCNCGAGAVGKHKSACRVYQAEYQRRRRREKS